MALIIGRERKEKRPFFGTSSRVTSSIFFFFFFSSTKPSPSSLTPSSLPSFSISSSISFYLLSSFLSFLLPPPFFPLFFLISSKFLHYSHSRIFSILSIFHFPFNFFLPLLLPLLFHHFLITFLRFFFFFSIFNIFMTYENLVTLRVDFYDHRIPASQIPFFLIVFSFELNVFDVSTN